MDKIAPGAWHDGSPTANRLGPDPSEVERLTAKRDAARWNVVMGLALMFGVGFHVGFAIGGAAMAVYGLATSFYWGRRLHKLKGDPWEYDPELDGPGGAETEFFRR